VFESPKRQILEGGALQRRPLKFFSARRGALSVRSALSATLVLACCVLPARSFGALTLTTGTRSPRRGLITFGVCSGARPGFPHDFPDRDRLALAGYVLLMFVLVHALVLIRAVVLVHALVLIRGPSLSVYSSFVRVLVLVSTLVLDRRLVLVGGRGKWRASFMLAIVCTAFADVRR
jgi:hypothetical protein